MLEYDTPLTTNTTADRIFGQPDFNSNAANNGGISAKTLYAPFGVGVDDLGDLYVADDANNRVLEYDTPLTNDTTADHVFGQPSFSSDTANNGGISAKTLFAPFGVALDSQGDLYVMEYGNNRVLEYNTPLTTDGTADRVIGQPFFSFNTGNYGGLSANSLDNPVGVAVDAEGNVYVSDNANNRVLEYDTPLTSDNTADWVFGQPGFTSNTANNGGVSTSSFNDPGGIALDAHHNLYISDFGNNRLLEYDWALVKVMLPIIIR